MKNSTKLNKHIKAVLLDSGLAAGMTVVHGKKVEEEDGCHPAMQSPESVYIILFDSLHNSLYF